jgi:hypothetical protein
MLKQNTLGIVSLMIAVFALGLAVIPGIALDRPVQLIPKPEPPTPPEPLTETKGGLTLRYKGFSVNVGGKSQPVAEPVAVPSESENDGDEIVQTEKQRDNWLRNFTLAAVCCALLAAVLGPIAWTKEKQPAITAPALVIATIALTWQYIAIGIAMGVTIAVVLFLLSLFS